MKARDLQEADRLSESDRELEYSIDAIELPSEQKFLRMRQAEPQTLDETISDLPMVAEQALDFTPVVGDVKAMIEIPEDMRMARDLMEQGYDEGSIIDMGLGAGLAGLSLAGPVPIIGDIGGVLKKGVKATAKERLADQTEQVFDKGISDRGRTTTSVEDAEFTGKGKRPTPKVFHGAKSMGQARDADAQRYEKLRRDYNDTYINNPVDTLSKELADDTGFINVDDLLEKQEVGAIQLPIGNVDGELDTIPVIFKRDGDKVSAYAIDTDTMKILDEKEPIASVETYDGGKQLRPVEMQMQLMIGSDDLSVASDMVGEKRIDAIKREGFRPYVADYDYPTDESFVSEVGLGGRTTGEHAELKQKMLSTSRDPLVAMKPNFGGRDTGNVVYADLPEGATRDMTPREYTLVTNNDVSAQDMVDDVPTGREALPPLEEGQVGYRLPKSIHLEAEEAIVMPENLNVKVLEDNPELAAKIQRGQDMVDNIISDVKGMSNLTDDLTKPAVQKLAYNKVRDTFKNLQSLGQYTEQYGARGTYDDLLESFLDDEATYPFFKSIIFDMPEQMKKGTEMSNNMTGLREVMLRIKQQRMQGARGKASTKLRNVPDDVIRRAVFGGGKVTDTENKMLQKAGIDVFFDNSVNLEKLGYTDLKKILFVGTQKFNRGGLASRK